MNPKPLTPLPGCTTDPVCTPSVATAVGTGFIVELQTGCQARLLGSGIGLSINGELKMADGSKLNPIKLPLMQQSAGTMPYVMTMSRGGELMATKATSGAEVNVMFSRNGGWQVGPIPTSPCFDPADVCGELCPADYVAGFRVIRNAEEEITSICLVKIDPAKLPEIAGDFWMNSNSVEIGGNGQSLSKYFATVKISADPGNRLEIRSDGLYVGSVPDSGVEI